MTTEKADKIQTMLTTIGLTTTEAQLYTTGLQYGPQGVAALVTHTGLNRATVYHAIDTLLEKGLAAKKQYQGVLTVTMSEPQHLEQYLKGQQAALSAKQAQVAAVVPLLQQQHSDQQRPEVLHYQGVNGVQQAVEDALYCASRHWDIIAPVKNFFSEFDAQYAQYFIDTRQRRGITARSLWEPKASHVNLTTESIAQRNPRILPPAMHGRFKGVLCLYDQSMLFVSSTDELTAVIIRSSEFYTMQAAIFEGLWTSATPIRKPL